MVNYNKLSAFTLIEMQLVLIITTVILLLSAFLYQTFNTGKIREEYFWRTFHSELLSAESYARSRNRVVQIHFEPHEVLFESDKALGIRKLEYPKGLFPVGHNNSLVISGGGHINPQTIKWNSKIDGHLLYQKFQLGWGDYHIDSTV